MEENKIDTLNEIEFDNIDIITHEDDLISNVLDNKKIDNIEAIKSEEIESIDDTLNIENIENIDEIEEINDTLETNDNLDNENMEDKDIKVLETKEESNLFNKEESYKVLSQYGDNFTEKEYLTNPAIGRDTEISQLIVSLLTPEKSAILVGKPGIGKTAIVEGLGYKIKNGDVPDALKGYTVFKLNTASLTGVIPETNELRIQHIVSHLKNLDKIMIFIDEIHTLIGNSENTLDFANIFKPVIDRGTIKIIGATTTDEYDRYVLRDKAFVRRFQKIDVAEPTRDMTIQIMMGTYPKFEKKMGLKLKYTDFIKETIMAFIVDLTTEFKRVYEISARYPDVSLTILQQAFSYAAFENRKEVTIRDIRKAIQTTKLVYPDVIKKELVRFNEVFRDVYLMETKQILKDEV